MSWEEEQAMAKRAESLVDSSWHYSWHWERSSDGYLTAEGWRAVNRDARSLLGSLEGHAKALRGLIDDIKPILGKYEEREAEEKEGAQTP